MSAAPQLPTVSFIGLGAMGFPMAARIASVATDWRLTVYDRVPAVRERAAQMATVAPTIEAAIASAHVVISMLPADEHVREVGQAVRHHARPGTVYADFSTIHPDTITEVAALLRPDVPVVSGSCMKAVAAAVTGDLTIFLGGEAGPAARMDPLLRAMATTLVNVGSIGAAKTLKLVNNMVVAGLNLAIADAAVIGGRASIGYGTLAERIRSAGHGGWAFENQFVKHTLAGNLGAGLFSVRYMSKDVALAARLADDYGHPRFLCGPLLAAYRGACALGHGDDYHPAVIRWLEATSATPPAVAGADATGLGDELATWVGAAEQLITAHGLDLAAATGVPATDAARALAQASAASRSMTQAAQSNEWSPDLERIAGVLAAVRQAAVRLDAAALTIEAAHDELARRTAA